MFARSTASKPLDLNSIANQTGDKRAGAMPVLPRDAARATTEPTVRPGDSAGRPRSVIGNDLTIIGSGLRIVSAGVLQIDGRIEGDVQGAEVIIGESGRLTGTIAAETVIVKGEVSGTIRGRAVTLEDRARVEGDIHHQKLSITAGAQFDGRSRRAAETDQLSTTLEAMAAPPPAAGPAG